MAILTVTTKLLNQTLDGPRIIDMGSTKTCQCFVIPRDSSIADIVKSHDALKSYAYYMLLGKINGKNAVYVGQTNDFTNRVIDHKVKKEFWDTALVFVSKAHAIYQSEVSFLEYLGWKSVTDAKNYQVENSKPILEPSVPQSTKDDMELFFEEIQFIARFFGCEAFDQGSKKGPSVPSNKTIKDTNSKSVTKLSTGIDEKELILRMAKPKVVAKVLYNVKTGTFILKQGSYIRMKTSENCRGSEVRKSIIKDHAIAKNGAYEVQCDIDITFEPHKPSTPACIITGCSTNGAKAFRIEDKTFKEYFQ